MRDLDRYTDAELIELERITVNLNTLRAVRRVQARRAEQRAAVRRAARDRAERLTK